MRFKDKVTIVTGAASGIGKAVAQGFAKEGGIAIILDKLEKEGQNAAEGIEAQGGRAEAMKLDATDGEKVKSAVKTIAEKWGRIDILINNIGWVEVTPFMETDEAIWRKSLDLNLLVPLRFCHEILPYMMKQQYGRIVNIASIAGRMPRPWAVSGWSWTSGSG